MATTTQIKFYKGAYGAQTAIGSSTANAGGIYFDETSQQIYVAGVAYGGAITDATFADNKLTITKVGTSPIVLDFSDTASASATMQVFNQLTDYIGVADGHIGTALDYTNTNYLTTSTNLVGADRVLDTQIKSVNDRIDGLDVSNVETVTVTTNDTTGDKTITFKGVSETNGIVEVGTRTDNITIKKVGFTGKAEDVAIDDTGNKFTATNVEDALAELKEAITTGDLSIDDQRGEFTSDSNSFVTISSQNKKLEVKLNENGYITKDANGLNLQHVDTTGVSTVGTDIATVNTVTAYISSEIADLDVTEYAQAEIASNGESFSVYGIKEEDGEISKGTSAVTLNFGSVYNATSNKVALVSNITDAINNLDVNSPVQAVTASDTGDIIVLTMKGVEEENGLIKQGSGIATVTFAKVAKTGAAADVTLAAANTPYVGSNVDETIVSVDSRIKALEELPTFDTVVSTNAATTPAGVTWDDVTGTLVASNDTMHMIYLVPASRSGQSVNTYAEYITVKNGNKYTWEKVGDTSTDLTGYVKTITVNGKQYAITANTTDVALDDVITNVVANDSDITSGFTGDYVDTKISVQTGTAANGVKISTVTSTSGVKVQAMSSADSSNQGLAEASDVKAYIGSRVQDLDVNETLVSGTNVSFKYKETDGIVEIGTLVVDYATVTGGTEDNPSIAVTDGSKLVTGNDILTLKTYVDDKISTVVAGLDADVTSDNDAVVNVEVKEVDGVITDVVVTTIEAEVTYTPASGNDPAELTAAEMDGAVIGSDIAAIKAYVDAKAASSAAVVDTLSTVAVNSGSQTEIATVGGQAINTAVSFTWEEYS